ncbi:hypothetical protein CISIN_1g0050321mg, partial [Citrus sinensis]
MFDWNDEE